MAITRRSFFKTAAAIPVVPSAFTEIPCHDTELWVSPPMFAVHLIASRERMSPKVDIETWESKVHTCEVCGEPWFSYHKKRQPFQRHRYEMHVYPVVLGATKIVIAIQGNCRIWLDGKELDWTVFETETGAFGVDFKQIYI